MTITDIGEIRNALVCITNFSECCRQSYTGNSPREWYYPNNGSIVRNSPAGRDFYRDRGPSVVRLNRRNNATPPTGIYQCTIPVNNQIGVDIYVGVYNANSGK